MDFTLTEEQEMLRQAARSLFTRECPSSLVRAHMDDPAAADPLWKHLREWTALAAGDTVDLCLFLEEAGAAVAPGPFFATTALFGPVLAAAGHTALESVQAGELTGTVAMAGADGAWTANGDPVKTFVPELDRVDQVAFVGEGPTVAVVPAQGLAWRPVATLDSTRRLFEVEGPADRSAAVPVAAQALADAVGRATVAVAAELVGAGRWLLDATVAYAKERTQFGRPIGSFQGLQFEITDMALAWERAAAAVAYAAMALDAADPDRRTAVHVAKAQAGEAARRCARVGMQVHGGIGYTWEHDLHLRLRRAYAGDGLLGPVTWHLDRLAELLFDSDRET